MSVFEECQLSEILREMKSQGRQSAHCMIWAPWDGRVFGEFPTKAAVLMQLRFDGYFGFPGGRMNGTVHDHQDIVNGLNRELVEEVNLDGEKFKVTTNDHMFSQRTPGNNDCFHFYALKVNMDDIREIERAALTAADYGDEAFGIVRVPLYTMENGVYGLPTFLKHAFIGIAKDQLLRTLKHKEILTDDEIQRAVQASQ